MKLRQVLGTVAISALTALGVVAGYNHFSKKRQSLCRQQPGVMPANYKFAGTMTMVVTPWGSRFYRTCQTAIPAVVHIKTKRTQNKSTITFPAFNKARSVIFLMMICSTNFWCAGTTPYLNKSFRLGCYHQR
jgi:hypothetical protein